MVCRYFKAIKNRGFIPRLFLLLFALLLRFQRLRRLLFRLLPGNVPAAVAVVVMATYGFGVSILLQSRRQRRLYRLLQIGLALSVLPKNTDTIPYL